MHRISNKLYLVCALSAMRLNFRLKLKKQDDMPVLIKIIENRERAHMCFFVYVLEEGKTFIVVSNTTPRKSVTLSHEKWQ